jgi:hypothetical protein
MKLTYIATAGLVVLVGVGVYLVVQNDTEGRMKELQAGMQADSDRKFRDLEKNLKEANKSAEEAQRKLKETAEAAKNVVAKTGATVTDPGVDNGLNAVKKNVTRKNGTAAGSLEPAPGVVASEPPDLLPDKDARAKLAEAQFLNDPGVAPRIAKENAEITNGDQETSEKLNELQQLILAQPRIAKVGDARAAENAGFVVLDEGLNKGIAKGDRFAVRRGTILVARVLVTDNIRATDCVADIMPNSTVAGMSVKNGDEIIKFDR